MRKFVSLVALACAGGSVWLPAEAEPAPAQRSAAAPQRPSAADFAAPPFLSGPKLSPDGTKVAVELQGQDGKERVGIYTVGKWDAPTSVVRVGELGTLRSLRWAGSERLLISVLKIDTIYGMKVPSTRLISYVPATGATAPIGKVGGIVGDDILYLDPDGKYLLLATQKSVSEYPGVDRVDLVTGATERIQKPRSGITDWYADRRGVVRAGIDYGERRSKIYYRGSADQPWRTLKISNEIKDESVVDGVRFALEPDKGIVITNARTGRFGVYRYDFSSDTLGDALFEHASVDVTDAVMGADGYSVDGVTFEDERKRTRWLNPLFGAVQAKLDKALPNSTNEILGTSRDGSKVLVWSGGASDPGAYFLFDQKARRLHMFAAPHSRIHPAQLSEVRTLSYAARDGLQIPAYLTVPAGSSGRNLPLILMPHGGPFERDHWEYDPLVQFLASRGYAVLQPQFRGSTGRGRAFVEAGHGQWGLKMQDDLDDGVDWAVRQGLVDGKRVCILGASYGGYAAMWGAIRNPERYRCAVSLAGVSDVPAMLKYDARMLVARRYMPQWRAKVAGEQKRDLAAVSPLQQSRQLRVPILIAHGEQDDNVPPDQSRRMVKALQARGAPVQSVFYPKSGHGITDTQELIDFMTRVEAFLARHNPA